MPNEIRVLPESVADKIAAGEVAERPSAIVKELAENAIDAGADKITVEIKNGGVKLIRVVDNGCGIPRGQVKTAFLRHATSKLRNENDLYSISTMGFRGEALSSICAVAKVEVITRTADEEIGARYVTDHGICGEAEDIACSVGTIMTVEDLFANVPARMKFLKKDSTEAGYVSDLMTRLALSKPDIAFEYLCDDKTVFSTNGDGDIKNVILKVYGLKFAKAVTAVDYTEGDIRITGAVGRPEELSFGNRTKQTILVNGRYIKNHVIAKIAEEAFRNTLMTGRFPFFVLNIEMAPELVDVNVHPAKTEVKFAKERELYDIIYHGVKSALYGERPAEKPVTDAKGRGTFRDIGSFGGARPTREKIPKNTVKNYIEYTKPKVDTAALTYGFENEGHADKEDKKAPSEYQTEYKRDFVGREAEYKPRDTEDVKDTMQPSSHPDDFDVQLGLSDANANIFEDCKIIGQVFDTYIILGSQDRMFLIDQHAALERFGFEELKEAYAKNEKLSQLLLTPITVNLSHGEHDTVMNNLDIFKRFGFEIEDFGGNSLLINETPIITSDEEIKSLFYELLSAAEDNIKHPVADFEEKALDMISCKKAIKGGDRLSLPEMDKVVSRVEELYGRGIKTCPHGRPIVISFSRSEIEKRFGRIV